MNKKFFEELQMVRLKEAVPEQGLLKGQTGTVEILYMNGLTCEFGFWEKPGDFKLVTLSLNQIEPAT